MFDRRRQCKNTALSNVQFVFRNKSHGSEDSCIVPELQRKCVEKEGCSRLPENFQTQFKFYSFLIQFHMQTSQR